MNDSKTAHACSVSLSQVLRWATSCLSNGFND